MKKITLRTFVLFVSLLSTFLMYKFCYLIAETYFFDKIFFKKSMTHGYGYTLNKLELAKYDSRSKDIIPLLGESLASSSINKLGTNNEFFNIAMIGDSLVWGVGVKEDDTFSSLVSEKLNKIKKTRILRLGYPGDSLIDNYSKYLLIKDSEKIDLYILVLVENDLLFRHDPIYLPEKYADFLGMCNEISGDVAIERKIKTRDQAKYLELFKKSLNGPKNLCIAEKILKLFPQNDTLVFYIGPGYVADLEDVVKLQESIKKTGLNTISSDIGRNIPEYKKVWEKPDTFQTISKNEFHPSKLTNKMFADILYNEIVNNSQWKFR